MGHTIIEKIIGKNIGREVKPGDIVTVNVDRVMIHDIFIPFVKEKFEEMGFTKIWDPDKAVLIYDHLVPASQVDDTRHFRIGNECGKIRNEEYPPFRRNLPSVNDRGRLCKAGRYRIWYRQPHNNIRLCWCIFIRYRIYRDGKCIRNRQNVG